MVVHTVDMSWLSDSKTWQLATMQYMVKIFIHKYAIHRDKMLLWLVFLHFLNTIVVVNTTVVVNTYCEVHVTLQ